MDEGPQSLRVSGMQSVTGLIHDTDMQRSFPGANVGNFAACSNYHDLVVDSGFMLHAKGVNEDARLPGWPQHVVHTPKLKLAPTNSGEKVVFVAASDNNSFYITKTADNTTKLFACGCNDSGQLGDGTIDSKRNPIQVMEGTQFNFVATGNKHTLMVTTDGVLYGMGCNRMLGLLSNTEAFSLRPVMLRQDVCVRSVAIGETHSLAVTMSNKLYAMGSNACGQLGNCTITDDWTNGFVSISDAYDENFMIATSYAGDLHSLLVKTNGDLMACGNNQNGQLGNGTLNNEGEFFHVAHNVRCAAAGENFSLFVQDDNALYYMGTNRDVQQPKKIHQGVHSVVAYGQGALVTKRNGTVIELSSLIHDFTDAATIFDGAQVSPCVQRTVWPKSDDHLLFVIEKNKKMFEDPTHKDVTLKCQDADSETIKTLQAHRVFLTNASPKFEAMLSPQSVMQEATTGEVLVESSVEAVNAMLAWIYTGELPPIDLLPSVLELADYYMINRLAVICCEMLLENMEQHKAILTFQTVHPYMHQEHLKHTCKMIENRLFRNCMKHQHEIVMGQLKAIIVGLPVLKRKRDDN